MQSTTHSVYIDAAAVRVWQALTTAELTPYYFHGLTVRSSWRPGTVLRLHSAPEEPPATGGRIVHVEPGSTVTYTICDLAADPTALDPDTWVTWLVEPDEGAPARSSRVTLTVDTLDADDPAADGSWLRVLSSLKTFCETALAGLLQE